MAPPEADNLGCPVGRGQAGRMREALSQGSAAQSTPYGDIRHVAKAFHPDPMDRQEGFEEEQTELDDPGFPGILLRDSLDYAWYRRSISQGRASLRRSTKSSPPP
ncbi:Zinc finger ring fyve phd-type protein [Lasiodiplodia theobromae]|uniref:Zinc finger ring fyve phd-type protein n=1 Tax=Lasiodiplodia theobromae TaxID=45133 RepID=UPI0015C2FC34|nr:Zinc finger ring fyve phd-type protein [Lasiodiplodia theobromae]KAF4541930.1 Zinc finger ring fyve phd-type protein [Lasiodiplodia theobromae]